jgi:hypothetical protein
VPELGDPKAESSNEVVSRLHAGWASHATGTTRLGQMRDLRSAEHWLTTKLRDTGGGSGRVFVDWRRSPTAISSSQIPLRLRAARRSQMIKQGGQVVALTGPEEEVSIRQDVVACRQG